MLKNDTFIREYGMDLFKRITEYVVKGKSDDVVRVKEGTSPGYASLNDFVDIDIDLGDGRELFVRAEYVMTSKEIIILEIDEL